MHNISATEPLPSAAGLIPARRLFAFLGPGYLVAVGYMDPGNWATSIAAGSAFGYQLLFVVVASSLMAILFQSLCARLGLGAGMDLAQACRRHYSRPVTLALWGLAEIAIIACDLAELIGAAVALNLLFGLPLVAGMIVTALDVFILLWLFDRGVRTLEAVTLGLVLLIGGCFAYNLALAQPEIAAVLNGLIPRIEVLSHSTMLWLAVGIVGATVMPHNLYLHSSLVRTREVPGDVESRRHAIAYATIDSSGALLFALFINGAILVLSAATFFTRGMTDVNELQQAHALIAPALGGSGAAIAFAVALLASGFASTVTATLAGQVVMEGFLSRALPAWVRRFVTRAIAIVPAVAITMTYGASGTATLLIASQVVLSLQLPFALVPLVRFTTSRRVMGKLAAPRWLAVLAWACCSVIVLLNLTMLGSLLFLH